MPTSTPILALLGPTGVGKTAVSVELARRSAAEIISCDSRQVYRQMTIGTAKPSDSELEAVPHHFINELELTDPFSAGVFAAQANARVQDILARGKRPIIVGGATLYVEALLHGFSDIPPTTAITRQRLMDRVRRGESKQLFIELKAVDPIYASSLDETKTHRVVRALEVYLDTGHPLSSYHARRVLPGYTFRPVVLHRPRPELYARINTRVEHMIEQGLLDEVESILAEGFSPALNALRTIGYREPIAYLSGEIEWDTMVESLKRNSRRYAKRQLTWYRRRPEYEWVDVSEYGVADIASLLRLQ